MADIATVCNVMSTIKYVAPNQIDSNVLEFMILTPTLVSVSLECIVHNHNPYCCSGIGIVGS